MVFDVIAKRGSMVAEAISVLRLPRVIPACFKRGSTDSWIPAFAGMTKCVIIKPLFISIYKFSQN
ncbi:MAG: hypothetical protein A3G33_07395 [Omnitrophica bacterium RIFCSPLOWO2_12_FULL_44_17]|uniref:Uncharacterized protein n=1 Tax=Candidatus Danuiimicrobium aquiferis TaxID=1801832 RepID=A0A1G1KYR8_9BACT|nr:MAG: hypothetical protein A3B72_07695 [Omnitrophica bacterium RIFCSPHIGHO2_02_FULL_45_28]OGW90851.1 MAG: hypothetical protein A3E74_09710 [Omnitrophica bacterium RIFCSPHIGHO2_12_FULL_44_12]OGW98048.1 MAG: hypothetical protein A3G33_07395 [Omnitrophica bacterium RIFCSPLOWO2_12_FULL_44_17]OGX03509.1 MAG: hypothetical protein A3J12_02835 [Omnitrophica bacterium RIFCSPLOWO2_02_FULL_44_11]